MFSAGQVLKSTLENLIKTLQAHALENLLNLLNLLKM